MRWFPALCSWLLAFGLITEGKKCPATRLMPGTMDRSGSLGDFPRFLGLEGLTAQNGASQTDEQKKKEFWRGFLADALPGFDSGGGGWSSLAGF